MKSNYGSLTELAQEIERQEGSKSDLLVPDKLLKLSDNKIIVPDNGEFTPTDHFHGQLAAKLQIPKPYYDRIGEIPGLRDYNVNALLANSEEKRLVRTLDGRARAYLSDSFKPVDNVLLLSAFLPVLSDYGNDVTVKCNALTDQRLYLQVVFNRIEGEVTKGDVVKLAVTLVNSEIGLSYAEILSSVWRLVCENGLVSESVFKKRHAGRRVGDLEDDYNIFRSDTIKAELESYRLRIRDLLANAVTEQAFTSQIEKLRRAADDKIEASKVSQVIENVTRRYGIPQAHNEAILGNVIEEGNISRYGIVNGITALAKSLEPDQAFEAEQTGGKIIELSPREWEIIRDEDPKKAKVA
jgi:hypothetical protein